MGFFHSLVFVQQTDDMEMSEPFMKTLTYSQRMAKHQSRAAVHAVRVLLSSKPLHRFELVQLANLCPENAEEAKSLVPTCVYLLLLKWKEHY